MTYKYILLVEVRLIAVHVQMDLTEILVGTADILSNDRVILKR